MKIRHYLAATITLLLSLGAAQSASLTYTSKAAFLADLQPGYYLNDFTGLPSAYYNNFSAAYHNVGFAGGSPAVGYVLDAPTGLFFTDYPIYCSSPFNDGQALTVTFTNGNEVTIGANLFLTDLNGNPLAGSITVAFSDGTTATVPSTSSTTSFGFFGIASDTPITSMTLTPLTPSASYVNIGNLYVSAKASVPATTVSVVATTPNASQSGPTPGVFTITRTSVSSDYSAALPVTFFLGGTATAGVYTCAPAGVTAAATNTVTIAAGQTSTNITITPVQDGQSRPTTTVVLSLLRGNNYAPTAPSSDTVYIQNTGPQLLFISGTQPSMYKRFGNDYGEVQITRWGDTNAASYTVSSFTYSGAAALGTDFSAASTVTFNPGDLTGSTRINPLNSNPGVYAGNKTFTVGLASGGGHSVTGTNVALTIVDSANPPATLLYTNPLTSAADAVNWNITSANVNGDTTPPDYEASFGYDLAADPMGGGVITNPPGGATSALRVTINKTNSAAAGVDLYLTNVTFSGDFAVRFNMNIVVDTATGTTQGPIFGINHNGLETNWWSGSPINSGGPYASDGLWFWISADRGAGLGDYVMFTGLGGALPNTGYQLPLPSQRAAAFVNVFKNPAPYSGYGGAGLVANDPPALGGDTRTWSDVEIKQVKNVVSLWINKNQIFQYTNTTTFTNGHIMLGYIDPYSSLGQIAGAAYFANLSVVRLTGPTITQIVPSVANVTLNFTTKDGTDTTSSFAVQSSATVNGSYTDVSPAATVTQSATGVFQTTVPKAGAARFYRIRHK